MCAYILAAATNRQESLGWRYGTTGQVYVTFSLRESDGSKCKTTPPYAQNFKLQRTLDQLHASILPHSQVH